MRMLKQRKKLYYEPKRIYCLLLIFILVLNISIPVQAYPERTVYIRVFKDASYQDMYSSNTSELNTTMTYVSYPFFNKWNIVLSPSYTTFSGAPLESCGKGYYTVCNNTQCGSTCQNNSSTPNHHKNFDFNYYYIRSHASYSAYDLGFAVTSAKLCHKHSGGTHDTCGLGMVSGNTFGMAKQTTSRGTMLNVRVIQHELSHCYGCSDHSDAGERCIMSGGFDNNYTYNLTSIWCTTCTSNFNRTAH